MYIAAFILLLVIIIFILFYIGPFTFRRVRPGDNYKVGDKLHSIPGIEIKQLHVYFLKHQVLSDMRQLLEDLHIIFTENNIPYWITCGTLLGCSRHNGFIPWDDDIDINVELKYRDRLFDLLSEQDNMNYVLYPARGGYKFGFRNFSRFPFVDIIIVNENNSIFQLCYPLDENGNCTYEVGKQWPNECFPVSDVYPLKKKNFEDFEVFVPKNYEILLHRIYGEDCLTAAGTQDNAPYAYSLKSIPWLMNHYYDNILFRLGLHKG